MSTDWGTVSTNDQSQAQQNYVDTQNNQRIQQQTAPQHALDATSLAKQYPWLKPHEVTTVAQYFAQHGQDPQAAAALAKMAAINKFNKGGGFGDNLAAGIIGGAKQAVQTAATATGDAYNQGNDWLTAGGKGAVRALGGATDIVDNAVRLTVHNATSRKPGAPVGLEAVDQPGQYAAMGEMNPAAQALKQLATTGHADTGTGWSIQGTAGKAAMKAQAETGYVPGTQDEWTLGRLGAFAAYKATGGHIFQPGSTPYQLLSGGIDFAKSMKLDLAANALTEVGDARNAAKALDTVVPEADIAKAADKAPEAYAEAWKKSALVEDGTRKTVVPSGYDNFLLSKDGQTWVHAITEENSPYAVHRLIGEPADPSIALKLAASHTDEQTISVLRQAGSVQLAKPSVGAFTNDIGSLGVRVNNRLDDAFRIANANPNAFLDPGNPPAALHSIQSVLANANIIGKDAQPIMDQAMKFLGEDPSGPSLYGLQTTVRDAQLKALTAHGVDEPMAKKLVSWAGDDRVSSYMHDPASGEPINLPFEGPNGPIEYRAPVSLYELQNHAIPLLDPSKLDEVRRLTGALAPITHGPLWGAGDVLASFITDGLYRTANVLKPAIVAKIIPDHFARVMANGQFEGPIDYLMFMAKKQGEFDPGGEFFDSMKAGKDITEKLVTATDAERPALQAQLQQVEDHLQGGVDQYMSEVRGTANTLDPNLAAKAQRQMYSTNVWGSAYKNVGADAERWTKAVADEHIAYSSDPILKRVANGGLFDTDAVGAERTLYHGSTDISDGLHPVDLASKGPLSNLGPGFYVTDSQQVALRHAAGEPLPGTDPVFREGSGVHRLQEVGGRLKTINVDGALPKDAAAVVRDLAERALPGEGLPGGDEAATLRRMLRGQVDGVAPQEVITELQGLGYEGVEATARSGEGGMETAVWSTNRLGAAGQARPGLDGIKDWLVDGAGQKFRQALLDKRFPGVDFTNDANLQSAMDLQIKRVEDMTGGNPDLKQAIATGALPDGTRMTDQAVAVGRRAASDAYLERLEEFRQTEEAPNFVHFDQALQARGPNNPYTKLMNLRDGVVNSWLGWALAKPDEYLNRGPEYRAATWNRMEHVLPWMDADGRAAVLANAEKANLSPSRIDALRAAADKAGPDAAVSLKDGNLAAHAYAAEDLKKVFYDSTRKGQLFNTLSNVAPYGDVWKEFLGSWAGIAARNPQIPRRLQQTVEGVNGSGFAYPDPTTGEERFGYPMPDAIAKNLGVSFNGNIAGVSLGTSVVPGLGPIASVGASKLAPDLSNNQAIYDLLFPNGRPDTKSPADTALTVSGMPAWAKKVSESLLNVDPNSDRIYWNTWMELFSQQVAEGKVPQDPEGQGRIDALKSTANTARQVMFIRGMLQAVVPSSPNVDYDIATKGGDATSAVLAQKFHDLQQQEQAGKIPDAVAAFTQQYGDFMYIYMVGKTATQVGGLGASTDFAKWASKNKDLLAKYPKIAGYLGPDSAGYDPTVVDEQESSGLRTTKSPEQRIADGQQLIANYYYRQSKAQLPIKMSTAQKTWLASQQDAIKAKFPLWDPNKGAVSVDDRDVAINQLKTAAFDKGEPGVTSSPVGQALQQYFTARDSAAAAAKSKGIASWQTANGAAPMRDFLRGVADQLSQRSPEFKKVYQDVLDSEMKQDTTTGAGN